MKKKFVNHKFHAVGLRRIKQANDIIAEYQAAGYVLTLRQLYYRFVAKDLMANSQRNYKNLGKTLCRAREAGLVDWNAIEDRTRGLLENSHWSSPGQIVDSAARSYAINTWYGQDIAPEVWIEKDALAGVIAPICQEFDVPFFSCRGYTSVSEMYSAGRRLLGRIVTEQRKPIIIHLGDHDPSGMDMTRDIQRRLSLFAEEPIEVRRIALNMDQIRKYDPPPNPVKFSDARSTGYEQEFGRQCWELDALEPPVLAALVREEIDSVCDHERRGDLIAEQESQREGLHRLASNYYEVMRWLDEQA